ncbi:cytosine deaminase [Candidatus Gracilibacteria bacterium]|nr:cytosine deaminase [Candidatus Gracilibacteria bacterium]NJP20402.1 cytosine deaminase [Hydrococcus sp. CRU_1_1]
MIPKRDRYWLKNAHIPACLIENSNFLIQTKEGLSLVDLEISEGNIVNIIPASFNTPDTDFVDLHKGIIFPGFIDIHTHLDKGHIWERSPNLEGTFDNALTTAKNDSQTYWKSEDLYRRMEFGIKCSYAHGTTAIRTHIDSFGEQAEISFEVFKTLQKQWSERIILQAVSLVSLDYYQISEGIALADKVAELGGILGGVAYTNPDLDSQINATFLLAKERNLNLDFHVDENGEIDSICLQKIAEAALRHQFTGKIICGHCCSLAVQPPEVANKTIELVKQANIGIVSLPMCNLYLQDRQPVQTPYWRGVTKVKELKKQGITVTFGSDNCRDPFYGFGDHDGLEVFTQAVRIAHLDTPYEDWCSSVTKTPADLMGLPKLGRIGLGLPADLVLFKARYFSELLSRSQRDRIVIRQGKQIDTTLPDYSELDDLVLNH